MGKQPFHLRPASEPIFIKGAEYWDSDAKKLRRGDVIIESGKITRLVPAFHETFNGQIINASNLVILPGLFDMHVHLREPGGEHKETILSGCQAAAAGGFTGICPMPNTTPVIDSGEMVRFVKDKAQGQLPQVFPIGAISKGLAGETLAEIGEMVKAGAVAVSDDGHWVTNSGLMRRALEYSSMLGIPVISHAADEFLCVDGAMNEGFYSTRLGLPGMPPVAEVIAIARDIHLAEFTKGTVHIAHVSTRGGIELIRRAKHEGIPVTCEVTPHHLCLTEEAMTGYDTNLKMNPPLRSAEDQAALIAGLKDGTIDAIASDHAPHAIQEKEVEFTQAPFGCIGMETVFSTIYTKLVHNGTLNLKEAIALLTEQPRRILHREVPAIQVDKPADFVVLNLGTPYAIQSDAFYSRSRNCPFESWEVFGRVEATFNGTNWWLRPGFESVPPKK